MAKVAFSNCPRCAYDLQGLPGTHRCPECGLVYDELTHVWQPVVRWYLYVALGGCSLLLALLIGEFVISGAQGDFPSLWDLLFAGFFGWVAYRALVYIIGARRKRLFVAITPSGIMSNTSRGAHSFEWHDVPDGVLDPDGDLPPPYRRRLDRWSREIFRDRVETAVFSALAARAKRSYGETGKRRNIETLKR